MDDYRGPAFPNSPVTSGMSLRDWFAGQALAGLASMSMHPGDRRLAVEAAYQYADAMLAQRAVKGP